MDGTGYEDPTTNLQLFIGHNACNLRGMNFWPHPPYMREIDVIFSKQLLIESFESR